MEESSRTSPDESGRPGGGKIIEHEPTAIELLIADLNKLRRDAGNPSLGQLVRLSQHKLTKSTLDDHLSGRRTKLPSWRLVSAYVSACHAAAASTGLDGERLGALDDWHARWSLAFRDGDEEATAAVVPKNADHMTVVMDFRQQPDIADLPGRYERSDVAASDKRERNSVPVAPVLKKLEEDLLKLGQSLPAHKGILIVTSGPAVGARFPIEHNITTIGRDPESDIWLNDPTISRRHAVIHRHGGRFLVRDSGSTNGTFIQRTRIDSEAPLSSYTELGFAIFRFLFIEGGQDAAKSMRKAGRPIRSTFVEDTAGTTSRFTSFAERGDSIDSLQTYSERIRLGRFGRRRRSVE